VTESEREDAIQELANLASGMSFEIVERGPKGKKKSKRKSVPKTDEDPGSFDEWLTANGMAMEDLPRLLTALYSDPAAEQPATPWYATESGRYQIGEFIEFCRAGEFRID
jgi:hypothetical protein